MTQAVQPQTNQMPAWLMSSGAVGIVGAIVKKHAEKIGELIGRLRSERPLRTARWAALNGPEAFGRRWERATEWPLIIAAVVSSLRTPSQSLTRIFRVGCSTYPVHWVDHVGIFVVDIVVRTLQAYERRHYLGQRIHSASPI